MAKLAGRAFDEALASQRNEITEHLIYAQLARIAGDAENKTVLSRISQEEKGHYGTFMKFTGREVAPNKITFWKYVLVSRVFGITFGIKLMESGERKAQVNYAALAKEIPEARRVQQDEEAHEKLLIAMLDEERLRYAGSVVLGLNDALVELSGALAGLTFALQKPELIGVTGLITGIAAALSMASSEYLSTQTEAAAKPAERTKNVFRKDPLKAAMYTGAIYLATVLLLVVPYVVLSNVYESLAAMLATVIVIIALFTYYLSVVRETPFWGQFKQTAGISLGIAAISFGIGVLVKTVWGIQI